MNASRSDDTPGGAATRFPFPESMHCGHLAVVDCVGADVAGFLNGQLSNDILGLEPGCGCLGAYCNPKGRVIAIFRILRQDDEHFVLVLPRELRDDTLERLRMYVLRSKVTFTERDDLTATGIAGDETARRLCERLPEPGSLVQSNEDGCLWRTTDPAHRFLHIAAAGTRPDPEDDGAAWLAMQAIDGVAEIFAATRAQFLPQALNLDLVGAVNFRKGCYPGQEIVARLRYLGKLKQRSYPVAAPPGRIPVPGEAVISEHRKVGTIVFGAALSATGTPVGLACIAVGTATDAPLSLDSGESLVRLETPYRIPEFESRESPRG